MLPCFDSSIPKSAADAAEPVHSPIRRNQNAPQSRCFVNAFGRRKDAVRCLAFTACGQLSPILLAEEDDVALGVSGVHHLRDFSLALPVLENALRTVETRQFVFLDLLHYDFSFSWLLLPADQSASTRIDFRAAIVQRNADTGVVPLSRNCRALNREACVKPTPELTVVGVEFSRISRPFTEHLRIPFFR